MLNNIISCRRQLSSAAVIINFNCRQQLPLSDVFFVVVYDVLITCKAPTSSDG